MSSAHLHQHCSGLDPPAAMCCSMAAEYDTATGCRHSQGRRVCCLCELLACFGEGFWDGAGFGTVSFCTVAVSMCVRVWLWPLCVADVEGCQHGRAWHGCRGKGACTQQVCVCVPGVCRLSVGFWSCGPCCGCCLVCAVQAGVFCSGGAQPGHVYASNLYAVHVTPGCLCVGACGVAVLLSYVRLLLSWAEASFCGICCGVSGCNIFHPGFEGADFCPPSFSVTQQPCNVFGGCSAAEIPWQAVVRQGSMCVECCVRVRESDTPFIFC